MKQSDDKSAKKRRYHDKFLLDELRAIGAERGFSKGWAEKMLAERKKQQGNARANRAI